MKDVIKKFLDWFVCTRLANFIVRIPASINRRRVDLLVEILENGGVDGVDCSSHHEQRHQEEYYRQEARLEKRLCRRRKIQMLVQPLLRLFSGKRS